MGEQMGFQTNLRTITKYTDRRLRTFVTRVPEMTVHGRWRLWAKRRNDYPLVTGQDPFFLPHRALVGIQTSDRLNMLRIRVTSDFSPRCKWHLCPSGMLRSVQWCLSTFRDTLSVPSWRVQVSKKIFFVLLVFLTCLTLEDGTDYPETSVRNYQSTVRNIPEEST